MLLDDFLVRVQAGLPTHCVNGGRILGTSDGIGVVTGMFFVSNGDTSASDTYGPTVAKRCKPDVRTRHDCLCQIAGVEQGVEQLEEDWSCCRGWKVRSAVIGRLCGGANT